MKVLAITLLAAAASAAGAQTVPSAPGFEDVPSAQLRTPISRRAVAGVTWDQRAPAVSAPPVAASAPPPIMSSALRPLAASAPVAAVGAASGAAAQRGFHGGGHRVVGRGPHRGPRWRHVGRFPHVRRFNRGFFISPFFFGPQFRVFNWQLYGFQAPLAGHNWVRHYDDAYLIDERGRVHDYRYDMDWDRYGEPWGYDDNGIPAYAGPAPGCAQPCGPPPPPAAAYLPPFCPPPPGPTLAPPPPCIGGGYTWAPVTVTTTTHTGASTTTEHVSRRSYHKTLPRGYRRK